MMILNGLIWRGREPRASACLKALLPKVTVLDLVISSRESSVDLAFLEFFTNQ